MTYFDDSETEQENPPAAGSDAEATEGGEAADGDAGEEGSGGALEKKEIDALLKDGASAVEAIFNSGMIYYERLPMLEVIFDRLVRLMSTSLRNFTSDNVEITLDTITSIRFGDYIDNVSLPALISVFKAEEWNNHGLMTVESSLVYAIIDVLLGGRRGTAAMRIEGRPYTTIECNLVERLVNVVLADLCTAFSPICPVSFQFERLESNPSFAAIARPTNASILVKLKVEMDDRGGLIEVLLPYSTLEPVREDLLQSFMGEKFGRDNIWEDHLAGELWETNMHLDAVLDRVTVNLGEVLSWQIGSQLMLKAQEDSLIELSCGERRMFTGSMGHKKGNIAIQIEKNCMKHLEE